MDFFDLREPVSAWSHLSWLLLSIPGTWLLWRRGRGDRSKQLSLLIYGLSLAACFASSGLFHGVRGPDPWIERFNRLDHIAIYVLIAGSYTPVAWGVMRGPSRWTVLGAAWAIAAAGAVRISAFGVLPQRISTAVYLAMGWGAVVCYRQVVRGRSHRAAFPLLLGGVLYSVGAVLNVLRRPVLWPGVFEAHELFHLFVMAGSLAHFLFILGLVAPTGGRLADPVRLQAPPSPHVALPAARRGTRSSRIRRLPRARPD